MSGLYAVAGALLVLAGCTATPEVTRPVRGALLAIGLVLLLGALLVSIAAATLEGP